MTLLQHSKTDTLRVKFLKPIKKAFNRKELSPYDYANFVDRLLIHQVKPQLYGQSFSLNNDGKMTMDAVVDPKNLEKRRKRIGLPTISEYAKMLEEMYNLKSRITVNLLGYRVVLQSINRAQQFRRTSIVRLPIKV